MRHYNIPIFVPHYGCPYNCTFCNQKKITGQENFPAYSDVKKEIEKHLLTFEKDAHIEVAFFGGSFTGIPEENQIELLEAAYDYVLCGKINGIRLSTRPDYISGHILDYLQKYKVSAIELGVQSMDNEVLKANNRGHTDEDVKKAVRLIRERKTFELGLQQMTGLYLSTAEKDIFSAEKIAELMPDTVRIYPTIVLEGTQLHKLYKEGKYVPQSLEEAVCTCSKIYKIYEEKNIRVIRLGLQSTEIINEGKSEIAGPYHSSFGEIVLSRLIRNEIEKTIDKNNKKVIILSNKKLISKITGNKKENIFYFKEKYGIDIIVKEENINYYKIIAQQ